MLVAVFEEDSESRIIFTKRSAALSSHTGQVSFPGGRADEGEDLVAAALRETYEEIGIDPASVEVLSRLRSLSTVSSQSRITPFVGLLPGRPELSPNPAEVERAFDVTIAEAMADGSYHEELWSRREGEVSMPFFHLGGETVWGATAHILNELLLSLVGAQ